MKKIIIFALSMLLSLGTFSGCNKKTTKKEDVITSYSFEQYDDLSDIMFNYTIGSMSITKDNQYITDGNGALKIDVERGCVNYVFHSQELPIFPRIIIDTSNKHINIANVSTISLDVFNLQAYTVNLITEVHAVTNETVWSEIFRLQPGMNNVSFNVKNRFYDAEKPSSEAKQFVFYFEGETENTSFSFDNLRIIESANKEEVANRKLKEGVILDFDTATDMEYVNSYINKGVVASYLRYGQGCLMMNYLGTDGFGRAPLSWYKFKTQGYGFKIDPALLGQIDNSVVTEYLVDVYLDAPKTKGIAIKIENATILEDTKENYEVVSRILIEPNSWQTVVVSSTQRLQKSKLTSFKVELETWDNNEPGCLQIRNIRYK